MAKKKKRPVGRPVKRPDNNTLLAILKFNTVEETAYMFGVKPMTVYSWLHRNKGMEG